MPPNPATWIEMVVSLHIDTDLALYDINNVLCGRFVFGIVCKVIYAVEFSPKQFAGICDLQDHINTNII